MRSFVLPIVVAIFIGILAAATFTTPGIEGATFGVVKRTAEFSKTCASIAVKNWLLSARCDNGKGVGVEDPTSLDVRTCLVNDDNQDVSCSPHSNK
jgi:hypothetical protein